MENNTRIERGRRSHLEVLLHTLSHYEHAVSGESSHNSRNYYNVTIENTLRATSDALVLEGKTSLGAGGWVLRDFMTCIHLVRFPRTREAFLRALLNS